MHMAIAWQSMGNMIMVNYGLQHLPTCSDLFLLFLSVQLFTPANDVQRWPQPLLPSEELQNAAAVVYMRLAMEPKCLRVQQPQQSTETAEAPLPGPQVEALPGQTIQQRGGWDGRVNGVMGSYQMSQGENTRHAVGVKAAREAGVMIGAGAAAANQLSQGVALQLLLAGRMDVAQFFCTCWERQAVVLRAEGGGAREAKWLGGVQPLAAAAVPAAIPAVQLVPGAPMSFPAAIAPPAAAAAAGAAAGAAGGGAVAVAAAGAAAGAAAVQGAPVLQLLGLNAGVVFDQLLPGGVHCPLMAAGEMEPLQVREEGGGGKGRRGFGV